MKIIENENGSQQESETNFKTKGYFKTEVMWTNTILFIFFHLYFIYGCFTFNFFENLKTIAWGCALIIIGPLGITGGAHRLWTHRSYKAKWPLRIILAICYASSGSFSLYQWVRDHRIHHMYTDTDADPHNSNRGFFFSHVGWLMMRKLPEVTRKGHDIDMSDFHADPIAVISCKYYSILKFIFNFFLPVMVPVYVWNETLSRSLTLQIIRYVIVMNFIFSINSAAHLWGSKPYNAHINPTENLWVSIMTSGEGWHNYHHVFPWDYKAAELSNYFKYNPTTVFIDFCAMIGWAYDLKQPSKELVKSVIMNKGDGTHHLWDSVPHPAKIY